MLPPEEASPPACRRRRPFRGAALSPLDRGSIAAAGLMRKFPVTGVTSGDADDRSLGGRPVVAPFNPVATAALRPVKGAVCLVENIAEVLARPHRRDAGAD